ncbi:MAG: hypothetical protein M1825_005434 [Sarcosagium campestre]|nr:MAG: hypothetical protein M1825_005434 [Sarcosagium campestre]
MSSIDELFKKPYSSSSKRKLEPAHDPNKSYKSLKVHSNGDAKGGSSDVEDVEEEDEPAGPKLPPDFEDVPSDDEDGRFFGGGVTKGTAEILDYVDEKDLGNLAQENYDAAWARKLALSFEKRITKNSELRAKFEGDPKNFMGSEADLDAEIKALSILSEHPNLYEEFVKLGCTDSLVSLLSHENTDIAIDTVEIISELTDEDLSADQPQWDVLVNAMLDADIMNLLLQNLSRFDEENESDRSGVYHVLSVLENFASKRLIAEKISLETTTLSWLLGRIQVVESSVSQNKQYAAEVLAILLQSSPANGRKFSELDGVDVLLQILSPYRKRDPIKGTEEEEFVENVFDCLTCAVDDSHGKEKFLSGEGVELCLIMLREGKMSKFRALRVLDHASGGQSSLEICERVIDNAGLKTLFGLFMKKKENQVTEHLLGIFSSFLRRLPADSAGRIRMLAKFVEKDYEKLERLVPLRWDYSSKVKAVDDEIAEERKSLNATDQEDMKDEWFSRRLDAGLFALQTIDIILAWLVAEDGGARHKIKQLLKRRDENLDNLKATLKELHETTNEDGEEANQTKEVLSTLMEFLSED